MGAKKADFWLCALSARLLSYSFALHDLMSWGLSEGRVTEDHIKNGTVTLARARDTHVFLSKWAAQAQDTCLAIPQDHPVAVSIAVGHDFLVAQDNSARRKRLVQVVEQVLRARLQLLTEKASQSDVDVGTLMDKPARLSAPEIEQVKIMWRSNAAKELLAEEKQHTVLKHAPDG